jgi:hypothetical protein
MCATPYIYVYDLPALILPVALLFDKGMAGQLKGGERKVLLLAGFIPLVAAQLNAMHIPLAAITLCALCWAMERHVRRAQFQT